MTFAEAFNLIGPDVEAIAQELGIDPSEADRLINEKLNKRYENRIRNERVRSELRDIRARRQV
jgi:hypothetical protein